MCAHSQNNSFFFIVMTIALHIDNRGGPKCSDGAKSYPNRRCNSVAPKKNETFHANAPSLVDDARKIAKPERLEDSNHPSEGERKYMNRAVKL